MAKSNRPTIWTRTQFRQWLQDMRGSHIVTIRCRTAPEMRRKDADGNENPYYGVTHKISEINCVVNFVYANSVNRQRVKEDMDADFEAQPRAWGERMYGTPIVRHICKGDTEYTYYLEVRVLSTKDPVYYRNDTKEEVDSCLIKPFLPKRYEGRQGTEKEIILRDYKIDSVVGFTWDGKMYSIVED